MRALIMLLFSLFALPSLATDPWGKSPNLKLGKALHDKACVSCHIRMYGKEGSGIYTRDGRLLNTQLELLQRVATCNAMTNSGWFPDEEAHVAAWLNKQYYHFEK